MKGKKLYIYPLIICLFWGMVQVLGTVFPWSDSVAYRSYFVVLYGLVFAVLIILMVLICKKIKWKYENLFVFLVISWGIIYSLLIPPASGLDEHAHYVSTYYASNMVLGIEGMNGRVEDDQMELLLMGPSPQKYLDVAEENWGLSDDNEIVPLPEYQWILDTNRYIATTIGVVLGRLLNLGFMSMIFLGRFFNTLLYAICGYIAVKITPIGKTQILCFSLIPMMVNIYSSYSYDTLSNSFVILFVALCMYYSECKRKINCLDVLLLIMLSFLILQNKGVYIAFTLLIFMIPVSKWLELWKSIIDSRFGKILLCLGSICAITLFLRFGLPYLKYYINVMLTFGTVNEQIGAPTTYTVGYCLQHPIDALKLIGNSFIGNSEIYFLSMMGLGLGHPPLKIVLSRIIIYGIAICFLLSIYADKGQRVSKRKMKILGVSIIICLALIIVGAMTRFTPIDSNVIGVTGRYLLPPFFVFFYMFGTDIKENDEILSVIYTQNILLALSVFHIIDSVFH